VFIVGDVKMKKAFAGKIPAVFIMVFSMAAFFVGCRSSDRCMHTTEFSRGMTSGKGPKRIYVPEYFIYRNGKYEFVKGHYRWVLLPKLYARRSLKGYGFKGDAASNR
jgi:hypothetical protein